MPVNPSPRWVADYYDRNTALFMRLGGSGVSTAAIHREIWAPGVQTRQQAFEALNEQILRSLPPGLPPGSHLLDLGCGLGGTSTWIAARLPVQVSGITISQVQAEQAARRAARQGLSDQCAFIRADFHALSFAPATFQAAWAVESLAHAQDPGKVYEQVARSLVPGGWFIVIDDFLAHPRPLPAKAEPWLAAFQAGWGVPNIEIPEHSVNLASQAGLSLVSGTDLTPYIRTVPAWVVHAGFTLLRLPFRTLFWHSLRGSTALQECLRRGWTGYHCLVFKKAG